MRGMGRHREGEGQSGPGWEAGPRGREDGPPGLGCGEGKWAMEKKGGRGLGWILFPFLFLKQTKFKPFEFKFELEFKPHSINKKLCASMTVQQVKPKINFNYLWNKIRLNASYAN